MLRPPVITRALTVAVETLRNECKDGARLRRLEQRLAEIQRELANLSDVAAQGGAVKAVLDALNARDVERRRFESEITTLRRQATGPTLSLSDMRGRLSGFLT